MDENNITGSYEAIDIAPANLKESIKKLIDQNYDGFNVTVPHKQSILELCDEIDGIAQQIGAVNTVIIRDGKLLGTNTDAFGFIENLKSKVTDFKGKKSFVIGAGGASRAVIYGLLQEGIGKIILANRTIEKAQDLQKMAPDKIEIIEWDNLSQSLDDVDILINTTSLGMTGKPSLNIDLSVLPKRAVVNDIVYAPLMTDLLVEVEKRGNPVVTGIGMLVHQARPAFKAWTGIMPDATNALEAKVLS
jgi:shikimate dehydrogenase